MPDGATVEPTILSPTSHHTQRRLPPWLKRPLPAGEFSHTRRVVAASGVATVCEKARCPNLSECWSKRHATFMILGDKCTRRCHFCAVTTARPEPPMQDEPDRLAEAVDLLQFHHIVLTAVARDDLEDEGAAHFARCVTTIHERCPEATVEVLPADFRARRECVATLCGAGPDIYNHNIEVVELHVHGVLRGAPRGVGVDAHHGSVRGRPGAGRGGRRQLHQARLR